MIIDEQTTAIIEQIKQQHEFLSFLLLEEEIIAGIIQNETQKIIMIYNLEKIRDKENRQKFFKYGDEWWWESNQRIPIDSFIGPRFDLFRPILMGYPKKSVKSIIGPTFNLSEQYLKRIKKKKIEIIRSS